MLNYILHFSMNNNVDLQNIFESLHPMVFLSLLVIF